MTGYRIVQAMALVAGLSVSPVFAQNGGGSQQPPGTPPAGVSVDSAGVPYRSWDLAVSAGLHVDREMEDVRDAQPNYPYNDYWDGGVGVQLDVGRYWTSHLKTEASVAYLTSHEVFGSDVVPVAGGLGQAFYQTDIARSYVGAAMTYQFFDNVFAHPYVSGGVRMSIFDRHKVRTPSAWVSDRLSSRDYPIPAFEVRDREVLVRPYVAAGFKSYFDERMFIRSEVSSLFSDRGPVHWALRLGFGVDF